jgi:hypothetical protein
LTKEPEPEPEPPFSTASSLVPAFSAIFSLLPSRKSERVEERGRKKKKKNKKRKRHHITKMV